MLLAGNGWATSAPQAQLTAAEVIRCCAALGQDGAARMAPKSLSHTASRRHPQLHSSVCWAGPHR